MSLRLDDCPGIGPVLGHCSGRYRWPTQRPSDRGGISRPGLGSFRSSTPVGGKNRLGGISKQGDPLFARPCSWPVRSAVIRYGQDPWHQASALAQGIVGAGGQRRLPPSRLRQQDSRRMAWAMMVKGERLQGTLSPLRHKRDRARVTGVM